MFVNWYGLCAAVSPGPVSVQVCATEVNGDCCGKWTSNVQVMYCPPTNHSDDYYVYKLVHSVTCDSAYCAIDRSDIQPRKRLLTTGSVSL